MSVRADLHCHTTASPDGSLTYPAIKRVLELGRLQLIAITDHNRIDEALRLQRQLGPAIIIGEEISTQAGEIVGLYLTTVVPAGLTAHQTITAIKSQGGLVYIPHPFERARHGLDQTALEAIAPHIDIMEVNNGRSFSPAAQRQAQTWSRIHGLAQASASDAHGRIGWGRVYTELASLPERDTLLSLLQSARLHGATNGPVSYLYPKLNRLRKARS